MCFENITYKGLKTSKWEPQSFLTYCSTKVFLNYKRQARKIFYKLMDGLNSLVGNLRRLHISHHAPLNYAPKWNFLTL